MKSIRLHGFLAEKYSKETIQLDADTPRLVVSGLCSMFGDEFKQDIRDNEWKIILDDKQIPTELINSNVSYTDMHIIPVVDGAAGGGKTVIGIALVGVGIATGNPWLIQAGAGLALSGMSQMLAPSPAQTEIDSVTEKPSFLFNGEVVNVTRQGSPVPVGYGEWLCSTVVISAGINSEEVAV